MHNPGGTISPEIDTENCDAQIREIQENYSHLESFPVEWLEVYIPHSDNYLSWKKIIAQEPFQKMVSAELAQLLDRVKLRRCK